jgi:hypothetical protein
MWRKRERKGFFNQLKRPKRRKKKMEGRMCAENSEPKFVCAHTHTHTHSKKEHEGRKKRKTIEGMLE